MIGSILFTWLQGAEFYRELHQAAVDSIPYEPDDTWVDIGCGPGLVARMAANNGFDAVGIDQSTSMIKAARRLAKWHGSSAKFSVGDLDTINEQKADVISAASLLAVVPDKLAALHQLWNSVRAGGHLLIIEPTELMNPENAKKVIKTGIGKKRSNGLKLWAKARENRAIDPDIFQQLNVKNVQCLTLLQGLVKAWTFHKELAGH